MLASTSLVQPVVAAFALCALSVPTLFGLAAQSPEQTPAEAPPAEKAQDPAPEKNERVRAGILAEYRFDEATGTKIHDRSGVQPPLDLVVENATAVRWISGGLSIQSPTTLNTPGPARRLTESIRRSKELTIEAWVRPANLTQDGTARLIGVSNGARMRNFTLGQGLWKGRPSDTFNVRLRTTDTDLDGNPMLSTDAGAATGAIQHLVYTRSIDGATRMYVDGQIAAEGSTAGNMENWDSSYHLVVANEIGATRPWMGDIFTMAVYGRALSKEEVAQNLTAGSGSSDLGHLAVAPLANTSIIAVEGEGVVHADRGWVLNNIGAKPLQWSISEDCEWLAIEPASGELGVGLEQRLQITLDSEVVKSMAKGTYKAQVRFENQSSRLGTCLRTVILQVNSPGTADGRGVKPGPHNTGPTNRDSLERVGTMTVTKKGTIIENVHVTGMLIIRADDVTVRNFVIDGNGSRYGLRCSFNNKGILIEDGEIYNIQSAGVYGGGFTARRLNIHESGGDGFKTSSGSVVESCWVHHLGKAPGAHADCNQSREGQSFVFRGNFFDLPIDIGAPYKSNACLIIQTGLGPIKDVLIEDNWLTGGNFTLYITDKGNGYGPPTNVRVINNRFGREYRYGVLDMFGYVHIEGNRWDDTDELMKINNQ